MRTTVTRCSSTSPGTVRSGPRATASARPASWPLRRSKQRRRPRACRSRRWLERSASCRPAARRPSCWTAATASCRASEARPSCSRPLAPRAGSPRGRAAWSCRPHRPAPRPRSLPAESSASARASQGSRPWSCPSRAWSRAPSPGLGSRPSSLGTWTPRWRGSRARCARSWRTCSGTATAWTWRPACSSRPPRARSRAAARSPRRSAACPCSRCARATSGAGPCSSASTTRAPASSCRAA
mmetsp:Transcript_19390/g.56277  ORF Transcript_19390/g.56277 Transcript_19390/m.56277 type:complete len:241 (+) Transcript_19390:1431-2153(+)